MKNSSLRPLFKVTLLLLLLVVISGCKNLKPRKPVSSASSSYNELSIEKNKKLYAAEEATIEEIIANLDRKFTRSSNGFYYHFNKKDSTSSVTPKFGDRVTFAYNVIALNGDTIYRQEELSPITKSLEQEYGVFKGMREALKLMHEGDQATFYFPSYMGYGYYGDENRIGTNVPFKSDVTLIGINKE